MEKGSDLVSVDNGEIFEGTRDEFANCFFDNSTNEQIADWCYSNDWKLVINGKTF